VLTVPRQPCVRGGTREVVAIPMEMEMEREKFSREDLEIVELPERETMVNLLVKLFKNLVHANAHI
jgi:hypothetical protein